MVGDAPVGLILAGGLARRLGGVDKALLRLGTGTVLDGLLGRIAPQCAAVLISANGDPHRFAAAGCPVIADRPGPPLGPLAGVLAGLEWLGEQGRTCPLLTVPGDTPFVPLDLVRRLSGAASAAACPIARVRSEGRLHPLVALWWSALREPLRAALHGRDLRKVSAFQAEVGAIEVDWPLEAEDPFFNINTPDELAAARRRADGGGTS